MRNKRSVDELSIEELERILVVKKREARLQQREFMRKSGRVVEPTAPMENESNEPPSVKIEPADAPALVRVPISASKTPKLAAMERLAALDQGVIPVFEDDVAIDAGGTYMPPASPSINQPTRGVSATPALRARPNKSAGRRVMDRALLFVEVVAVVGIIAIGINMVSAIGTLERETSSAQALADEVRRAGIPTIEPTPTLRLDNIVLPGGHTSPLDPGGAQFNYEEIPAVYRPLAQSEWVQPIIQRPPVTSETAVSISIPKLDLNATIVQGVDWTALQQGVGQVQNGVNPSDVEGNVVLAAHNDIYGELFRYLEVLEPGDPFQIRTQSQVHNYIITDKLIVQPNDVYVMENRGGSTVTLISCYPYQVNTQRIIIYAERVS